jgi:Protein of unknown function (DUF2911)
VNFIFNYLALTKLSANHFNKILMKKLVFLLVALATATFAFAQDGKKAPASPAATAKGKIGNNEVTVSYNAPAVKGRKIWGGLVPYDQVWRTGANGATTIQLSKDAKIEGQDLKAGKYSLFTIPAQNGDWTVIFNKKADQWGSYNYDAKEDALRVKVKSKVALDSTERLTFLVDKNVVKMNWEKLEVSFGVK